MHRGCHEIPRRCDKFTFLPANVGRFSRQQALKYQRWPQRRHTANRWGSQSRNTDKCSSGHHAQQKQQTLLMSSHSQQQNYTVYASGFTLFGKSTIGTFLRISANRSPGWRLVNDLSSAAVVLLSVTSREDIDAFIPQLAEWQKVLVVGSSSFGTRWPTVPRPIRLSEVVSTFTDLMRDRPEWSSAPCSPAPRDSTSAVATGNRVC